MAPHSPVAMTSGTFPIRLPGYVRLDERDIVGDPHDFDPRDGSCVVDFRTWQSAERYSKFAVQEEKEEEYDTSVNWLAKAAKAKSDGAALLSMLKKQPPANAKSEKPVTTNRKSDSTWPVTRDQTECQIPFPSFGAQTKYVVELSDLPRHLISPKNMEVILEQAEHLLGPITKDVLSIVCLPSESAGKVGKVVITLSSQQAADRCHTHFTTSKWFSGCSATLTVRGQGNSKQPEPATMEGYGVASSSRLNRDAPAYVHSSLANQAFHSNWKYGETSDASTEVSSEEEWCLGELSRELEGFRAAA